MRLRCRLPDGKPLRPGTFVDISQTRHAFLFGCLTNGWGLCSTPELEQAFRDSFAELFNYATVLFHWGRSLSQTTDYESAPDVTEEAQRRELIAWCRAHGMKVRGHPLVFFFQPSWLKALSAAEREERLWHRVEREARTFAGLVDFWDTVNEPTSQGRAALDHGGQTSHEVFHKHDTTTMIKRTHAMVRAADPDVRLVINEWDTSEALATVLDAAVAAGIEMNVIGFQEHCFEVAPDYGGLVATCDRYQRFGLPLHYTEVMMPSCAEEGRSHLTYTREKNKAWPTCPEGEERQAREIEELYSVLFAHPAVTGITWWGLSDFLGCCDAPVGLLHEDMLPKPAYDRLRHLIREKWWTTEEVEADGEGYAKCRGFLGDYRVRVNDGGRAYEGTFGLSNAGGETDVTVDLTPRSG